MKVLRSLPYCIAVLVGLLQLSSGDLAVSFGHDAAAAGDSATAVVPQINHTSCEITDSCDDPEGFEAIRALHSQLDDDASGTVDISETDEFIRGELQNPNGNERQIKAFHGSDTSISVLEMWLSWKGSEVHNWTVEETVSWLVDSVELPQYARVFQDKHVDGRTLPRMAVQNNAYLSAELGIRDPIAKQKLMLKAMDVVLFGPQRNHNWLKDAILVVVVIFASTTVWYFYRQSVNSNQQLQKVMKDLDSLQRAEDALVEMQQQLDKARQEQETLQENKKRDATGDDSESVIFKLQEEINFLQEELAKAQQNSLPLYGGLMVSAQLQHWLQLTHEIELKNYHAKKAQAENQLHRAKEECEKLRRKGQSFMGPFRLTHGGSIDDIDTTILQAKQALSEVTHDLSERLHRWRQIERLCGFNIVSNRGFVQLEALLHGNHHHRHTTGHQHPGASAAAPGSATTPTAGSTKSVISRSGSEATLSDEESPVSSSYANHLSSAPHQSPQFLAASAAAGCGPVAPTGNTNCLQMQSVANRRFGTSATQHSHRSPTHVEYQNQQPSVTHGTLLPLSKPAAALSGPTGLSSSKGISEHRHEESVPDMSPGSAGPVLFHLGNDASAKIDSADSPLNSPIGPTAQCRGGQLKGAAFEHISDVSFDESNFNKGQANHHNIPKNKRKGSAFMNAIRHSFTSASALVEAEENDAIRGSTSAFDDAVSVASSGHNSYTTAATGQRKKSAGGMLGAIRKIHRSSKDKINSIQTSEGT